VDDISAWLDNCAGDEDEALLVCLRRFRKRSVMLSFTGCTGTPLIFDGVS
jgi:hypothetical protein